jgi:hypothetical protein
MKHPGVLRWLLFQDLNSTLADPAPDFSSKQAEEHHQKPTADLAAEDRHGQTCFCNGEPRLFVELLDLDRSQWAKKEFLKAEKERAGGQEDEVR